MTSRIENPLGSSWRKRFPAPGQHKSSPTVQRGTQGASALEEEPLRATSSVLVVSKDTATGQMLGENIRRQLNCRVLQASGIAEVQYLVAVEGNIRLLVADSLSNEHIALARWFLATQPTGATVLIAERSLWKLTGGPGRCEQMLMAKSYTPTELASTVRTIVTQRSHGAPEQPRRMKDAA